MYPLCPFLGVGDCRCRLWPWGLALPNVGDGAGAWAWRALPPLFQDASVGNGALCSRAWILRDNHYAGIQPMEKPGADRRGGTLCHYPLSRCYLLGTELRKGGLNERRIAIIKEYDFYNQRYCGCEFSMRKKMLLLLRMEITDARTLLRLQNVHI